MGSVTRSTPTPTSTTPTTTSASGNKTEIGKGQTKSFTGTTLDRDRDGPSISALLATFGNGAMANFEHTFLDEIALEEGVEEPEVSAFADLLPDWAATAPEGIWGQVQQTGHADVMNALEAGFPPNSLLYVAFGPENLPKLDLAEEVTALQGGVQNLVVVWNPSQLALRALAESGNFAVAIVAGHGADEGGGVYMTDEEGKALPTPAIEFAALFAGTPIETVFLNACNGLAGDESVADALNSVGINVLGWIEEVSDSDAIAATEVLIETANAIANGASPNELAEVADSFDGPGGNLVADIAEESEVLDPASVQEVVEEMFPPPPEPDPYAAANYEFIDYGGIPV